MSFGRIIYGDNQFLGVNHYSSEKSGVYQSRFDDPREIIKCLEYAYSAGIRDFMYTPHQRYNAVFPIISCMYTCMHTCRKQYKIF